MEEIRQEYKFTKKDICKILGVNDRMLKKIEYQGQLESRLRKEGYVLYMKKKEGRKVYYLCLDDLDKEPKEEYNNFCKDNGIRKKDEFAKYLGTRITNIDTPLSKDVIANKSDINKHTVTSWDGKLIQLGLLSKDGWFYMAIDYIRNEDGDIKPHFRITDEWEYNSHASIKAKKAELLRQFKGKIIDETIFELAWDSLVKAEESFHGTFVYKLNKYKIKDLEQVENLMLLIKEIYNLKEEDLVITYESSVFPESYTNKFLEKNYDKLDEKI